MTQKYNDRSMNGRAGPLFRPGLVVSVCVSWLTQVRTRVRAINQRKRLLTFVILSIRNGDSDPNVFNVEIRRAQ